MQAPDKYFNTVHKKCMKHFDTFCAGGHADDLHSLRVSIKRISALLRMANKIKHDFRLRKSYKAYRTVFKHAGEIRETQLCLHELKRNKSLQTETHKLKNEISKQVKQFKANCADYRGALESIYSKLYAELKEIDAKQLKKYFAASYSKIRERCYTTRIASLHSFRKLLKQFIYNSGMMPGIQQKQLELRTLLPHMDKMQDLIGKWHDKDMLLTGLKQLKKNAVLTRLIKKEEKERDQQLIALEVMFAQLGVLMEKAGN